MYIAKLNYYNGKDRILRGAEVKNPSKDEISRGLVYEVKIEKLENDDAIKQTDNGVQSKRKPKAKTKQLV